jgi:hypothetical protein
VASSLTTPSTSRPSAARQQCAGCASFAYPRMKVNLSSIGRWNSSNPPSGEGASEWVVSLDHWVIASIVALSAIAAPVCRTIRHRQRVGLAKLVLQKQDITGPQAAKLLQDVIAKFEPVAPEPEMPAPLRAVQATIRMLPSANRGSRPPPRIRPVTTRPDRAAPLTSASPR